jgi:hypothetical protein
MNSTTNPVEADVPNDHPLDAIASTLYEQERCDHPSRNMPPWERANRVLRADARYRAQAAHHRSSPTIKAVLVEEIARTLATLDGFIWPSCENKLASACESPEQRRALTAHIRQRFRHNAREVITAHDAYLDTNAAVELEEMRVEVIKRAKAQQLEDVQAVQEWKRLRGQPSTLPASGHDGALFGDGRR